MATPRKSEYPYWFVEILSRAVRVERVEVKCFTPHEAAAYRSRCYAYRKIAAGTWREMLYELRFSIEVRDATTTVVCIAKKEPSNANL